MFERIRKLFSKKQKDKSDFLSCVMIVLNEVERDSRVKRTAKALQDIGCDVKIFGLSSNKRHRKVRSLEIDGIPTLLFPNPRFTILSSAVRIYTWKYITQGVLAAMWKYVILEKPMVLHTHDFHTLIIGKELSLRLKKEGHNVHWIHDFHEYVKGLDSLDEEIKELALQEERESIPHAKYLTTVSPTLAAALKQDYGLDNEPTVLYNAARKSDFRVNYQMTLRKKLNLPTGTALGVYIGGITEFRGLHTLIEAMPLVPELHIALVTESTGEYMDSLIKLAKSLKCYDRLHLLPYVDSADITSFLQDVTFGVHPMIRYGNAEVALPNKLFDYLHAKLPVIVSNCQTMENFVNEWGVGLVFKAEDKKDLAEKIKKILENRKNFTTKITGELLEKYSWESAERKLKSIYMELTRTMEGEITGVSEGFIEGWTKNHDFEIYEGIGIFHKNEMISSIKLRNQEIGYHKDDKENGMQNFSILLPKKYYDGRNRKYDIRFLPKKNLLEGGELNITVGKIFPLEGKFEGNVNNKLTGWIKVKNKNGPVMIAIYYNSRHVCSALADKIIEDKPECFGFNVKLPKAYRDGKSRKYWVKAEPWGIKLDGGPQTLRFN